MQFPWQKVQGVDTLLSDQVKETGQAHSGAAQLWDELYPVRQSLDKFAHSGVGQVAFAGIACGAALAGAYFGVRGSWTGIKLTGAVSDLLNTDVALSFADRQFWQAAAEKGISGIETAHPDRFLLRMQYYGYQPKSAALAEDIIARARDGIKSGTITSALDLDTFVAEQYYAKIPRYDRLFPGRVSDMKPLSRFETEAGFNRKPVRVVLAGKHEPYQEKLNALLNTAVGSPEYVFKATLDGKEVALNKLAKFEGFRRPGMEFTRDPEAIAAVDKRLETLFQEISKPNAARGTGAMDGDALGKFAEFDWLQNQEYRQYQHVAGISQIKIRALMEAAGYDSGRFRIGIDPNLEAFTNDLNSFKAKYQDLFQIAPYKRA